MSRFVRERAPRRALRFASVIALTSVFLAAVAPAAPAGPAAPVIALDMESPRMAAPGGVAVYTLRVTNNGARAATGVRVRQRLGSGIAAISGRGVKYCPAPPFTSAAFFSSRPS